MAGELDLQPVEDDSTEALDLQPVPAAEEDYQDEGVQTGFPLQPHLAEIRKRYAGELNNPAVVRRLYTLTHNEVGGQGPEAQQAFMETVLNRAASRNLTLAQTIADPKYYPSESFRPTPLSDQDIERYGNLARNAWAGSNISNYATGNASGNVGVGRQTAQYGGERFGVERTDQKQGWYEKATPYQRLVSQSEYVEVRKGGRPGEGPKKALPPLDLQPVDVSPDTVPNEAGLDLQYVTNLPPEEQQLVDILKRHREEAAAAGIYPKAEKAPPKYGPSLEEAGLEAAPEPIPEPENPFLRWMVRSGNKVRESFTGAHLATNQEWADRVAHPEKYAQLTAQAAFEPILEPVPQPGFIEDYYGPKPEGLVAQTGKALAETPVDLLNFVQSPGGMASLFSGGLPKVVQTLVAAGFSAQQLYEAAKSDDPVGRIKNIIFAAAAGVGAGKGTAEIVKERAVAAAAKARSIARVTPPGEVGPPIGPTEPPTGPQPAPVGPAPQPAPAAAAAVEVPPVQKGPVSIEAPIGPAEEAKAPAAPTPAPVEPSASALARAETDAEALKFPSPENKAQWIKNRAVHNHLEDTTPIVALENQAADLQNEVGYWVDHPPKTQLQRNAMGASHDALWKTWNDIHDIWDKAGLRYHMVQVGGGAGGLKAAHQAAYEGLRTLVIEKDTPGGAAKRSMELINVGAKGEGITGREYFRAQELTAKNTGAKIIKGDVVDMTPATDGSGGVDVHLKDGRVIPAYRVSAMTGTRPNVHPFKGSEFTGWDGNAEQLALATMHRNPVKLKGKLQPARPGQVGIVHGSGNSATQAVFGALRHGAKKIIMVSRSEFGPEVSPNQRNRIKRWEKKGRVELVTGSPTEVIKNPDGTLKVKVGPSKANPHADYTFDNVAHFENFLDRLNNTEWFPKSIERQPFTDAEGNVVSSDKPLPIKVRGASLKTNMEGVYAGGDIRQSQLGELKGSRINLAQGDATGNATRIAADIAIMHSEGKLPEWTKDLSEQQIDQIIKKHRAANLGLTSKTGGTTSGSQPPTSEPGWQPTSEPPIKSLPTPGEVAAETYLAAKRSRTESPSYTSYVAAQAAKPTRDEQAPKVKAQWASTGLDREPVIAPAQAPAGAGEVSHAQYKHLTRKANAGHTLTDQERQQMLAYEAKPPATTSPAPEARHATEFFSPNEGEMNFDQALKAIDGPDQRRAVTISNDINRQLGLKGTTHDAIGDWVDGAENSVMHNIDSVADFDQLRYIAAIKGKLLNQKSVLAFGYDPVGADAVHSMVVPSSDLPAIREHLTNAGLQFRTLLRHGKNTGIVIFDQGDRLRENVASVAEKYGVTQVQTEKGSGEFVGDSPTRLEAQPKYDAIISDYDKRYPLRNHWQEARGPHSLGHPAPRAEEVVPDPEELHSPKLLPEETVARPVQPVTPPPLPAGQVLSMGDLPVTMERTGPGNVAPRDVMDALKSVMTTSGSAGEIQAGRFQTRTAKGIFKPFSEVVRLEHIDDIPTAVHETGHALMKQLYGTVKSRGLAGLPSAAKRELVGLGRGLYGNSRPAAGYTSEGFSEFMRYYLTRDDAARIAPATNSFFETKVLTDNPQIAAQLRAARGLIDMYRAQGAMARANAQVVDEPSWTKRTLAAIKDVTSRKRISESADPLRALQREAERRLGHPLPPSEDPYKLFKFKRGASGPIVEAMVDRNMVDVWGNPVGPSLREAFSEIRGTAEGKKFGMYVYARRAAERWKKGINPGISAADAEYIKQTLESPKFDRAFSKYLQWQDGVLGYAVQADPKMADLVSRIKQGSSDYAPLARVIDERAAHKEALKSQANPLYRMKGSGLPIKPIFQQSIVNAARLVSAANRALVTNAVFKLSRIEGMGHYLHKVDRAQVMRQVNIEKIRSELEGMGVDTTNIPDDQMFDYYTPADVPKGSDPIIRYVNAKGQAEWYYVDPTIYNILEKIEPFSLRSIPYIGPGLDMMVGAPKRSFTLGTTGLRPTFSLVTNPLRDPQAWMMQTKTHANPAKMAAAYFQSMGELLWETATGRTGPYSQAIYNLGPQMAQALGRDIRYTRRAAKGLFHGRMFQIVRTPIDHLRGLLNVPEAFPRTAEFRLLADEVGWKPGQPITPDQAVEMSLGYKESTVDFSAAGDISRVVNEAVPFFNPSIQGVRSMVRAFRDHPYRAVLLGLSMFTGPTLYNWWKNKDKEWYINMPWRERYYYNNIDDGAKVWQIPRAFEYGNIFSVLPEAMMDTWYRNDPEALKQAVGHIFETQSPIQLSILPIVSDTVLGRVAKEQWSNNIDFWDRPIVPRSEVDLAPGAQVGPYTSKVATWLGKAFPNQVSPRRADAAIKAYFGGAVPDVIDAVGLGAQKQDRESEISDLPVIGKLWRRGGYYNAQSQHISDFYDIKETLDARSQAMKRQIRDPGQAQTLEFNPEDVMFSKLFDTSGRAITLTLRMADQMKESAGRQALYREAAAEAKDIVDTYRTRQQLK